MTLNLKSPEGVALFKKLAESADVIVENFRPDVKQRLGIDYESMAKVNPRIVYASISGFGQDGPYATRPGFDQIAQGMGGLMSITGLPGQGPVRVGIPIADLTAGIFAAQGILVALLEREVSGKGQWVQTSLLQAQVFMLDFQASRWLMEGQVPKQAGNNHPTSIPTGVFTTSDGYMNIAASGNKIWERCARALGRDDLLADERYKTAGGRSQHRDELNAELEKTTRTNTTAHWVAALNEGGVPCGPIYKVDEMFADPQVQHLGLAQTSEGSAGREVAYVSQPIKLSRTPSKIVAHPPELGQHTDDILAEAGLDKATIDDLRARQVI
jgi:formyl-CoA transferase